MNLNALDLNLVRVFDALFEERSATRAGERIGLSQPAVSSALGRLRHIFNDSLFVRHGNEMIPTPRAEDLAPHARRALSEIETMIRPSRDLELESLNRTFTLMGADFFSIHLMPHLARKVQMRAPGVRLRLLDSARGDVMRLLLDSTVDMALERPLERPNWISATLLFMSPFVIIGSGANPALTHLLDGDVLPLELFARLPHALRSIDGSMAGMVDDALAELGLSRNVMLALPHFHSVALAVAEGDYIAAIPIQFHRALPKSLGLRHFQLPISVPVPDVNLYWHSRHDRDPLQAWMRSQILETVEELDFLDDGVG